MSDRPILFSGPMVRALLDGRKTQTRRIATSSNLMLDGHPIGRNPEVGKSNRWIFDALDWSKAWVDAGPSPAGNPGPYWHVPCLHPDAGETTHRLYPKWQKGDRLWVRETWMLNQGGVICNAAGGQEDYVEPTVHYRADFAHPAPGWKSAIHMPRWASRLTLTVTDVRVQRLNEMSDADAIAEGVEYYEETSAPRVTFAKLWDSLNKNERHRWQSNPWVCAVTFRPELKSGKSPA